MAGNQGEVRGLAGLIIDKLTMATGFIGALAILAAALIVTEGVVVRKVFGLSTIWQIEMSVFLLMYACFVGAAFGQKGEHHLNVDLAIIHLKPRTREIVLLFTAIFSCAICALLAWHSWPMWWEAWSGGEVTESFWGPPLWIPYFFLPLGMTLLFLQYLSQISVKIGKLRRGEIEIETVRSELKDIEIPAGGKNE